MYIFTKDMVAASNYPHFLSSENPIKKYQFSRKIKQKYFPLKPNPINNPRQVTDYQIMSYPHNWG